MIAVVRNIKFRNARSDFQTTLQEDMDKTWIWIKLLKCTDLQRRNTTSYYGTQLLRNKKKTNTKINDKINKKGKLDFAEQRRITPT